MNFNGDILSEKIFEITDTGMLESLHVGHQIQHFDTLGFVAEFVVYLLTITAWWCGGKFLFAGKSLPSSPFPLPGPSLAALDATPIFAGVREFSFSQK